MRGSCLELAGVAAGEEGEKLLETRGRSSDLVAARGGGGGKLKLVRALSPPASNCWRPDSVSRPSLPAQSSVSRLNSLPCLRRLHLPKAGRMAPRRTPWTP